MKFLATQISYFLNQNQIRQNIAALVKYVLFLLAVIAVFSISFHLIMQYAEGRYFSWITGVYWTLTVMSTLGFGDITFESDIGRVFTILVLSSGILLLLIMLPFAFIRFFYAPWIEAQIHIQSPRSVPPGTTGHVIICRYDSVAPGLIKKLDDHAIPYFVLEPDSVAAVALYNDDVPVIQGDIDCRETYERMLVDKARLVYANVADTTNTNIILTIREISADVPIIATAENEDSIDILELSGATRVFPLKHMLGANLANRISAGSTRIRSVSSFDDWIVAEFSVQGTPLVGQTIRDSKLRERTGINIVGIWEAGILQAADPARELTDHCVPVCVGTREQLDALEQLLANAGPESDWGTVLIIGGGKVGCAAAAALKKKGATVFMLDCAPELAEGLSEHADRVTIGDAADRATLMKAGLHEAALVILSTNDDAVNIYLSIYCRRLDPELHIVTRITHEQNLEAMHRAGADFVLSLSTLGAEALISFLNGREPVIIGEQVEFFTVAVPPQIAGRTLAESRLGALTGLIVLAVRGAGDASISPLPSTTLPQDGVLTVLGTQEQHQRFNELFL